MRICMIHNQRAYVYDELDRVYGVRLRMCVCMYVCACMYDVCVRARVIVYNVWLDTFKRSIIVVP